MQENGRTRGSRAAVALSIVTLLCVLFVPAAVADPSEDTGLQATVTPLYADSYNGWRTQATHVSLMPLESGIVMYQWDSTLGPWTVYSEALLAPEGKHYLYSCLLTEDGAKTVLVLELKVDYLAPLRAVSATDIGPQDFSTESFAVQVVTEISPWAGTRVQRLGGDNRYETSALISGANFD
ncbi:MAG: hypothetical protein PF636_08000, partial [Actinomycetota bacterium]|nr:hypothetical protein [Actinomycetota bacterium]